MTKDDIIALPNPLLHERSTKVKSFDDSLRQLAGDMIQATLDWEDHHEHEIAVALAAIQIAKLQRLIIIREKFKDKTNSNFKVYINPEIIKLEGELVEDLEGCLSVKGIYGKLKRHSKVKIKAQNLEGKTVRVSASGFLARVLQHEIDHTNGLLFVDRIKDPTKLFKLEPEGHFTPLHL